MNEEIAGKAIICGVVIEAGGRWVSLQGKMETDGVKEAIAML